jgi:hypothetical protein
MHSPLRFVEACASKPCAQRMAPRLLSLFVLLALTAGTAGCGEGAKTPAVGASPVVISLATPRLRTTTWSLNYWGWMPALGDDVSGTEATIAALKPAILRMGGYNNDANSPNAFNDAAFDKAVAYARAIGAEPLVQVPVLAGVDGGPANAAGAAAMVAHANVTRGYGIKYFSIGNEPDLYATQGSVSDATKPAIPGYGPSDYCATALAYVTAMKAVDPAIQIIGPDLSWKYSAGNDWLTPILKGCGALFDVIAIHRYPFSAKQATFGAASKDATTYATVLASLRDLMQAAGQGEKPLAVTEMNIAYDQSACSLDASPGTMGSALWLADNLGTGMGQNLWTSAVWNISDPDRWGLGLLGLPPSHTPRPEYYANLLFAEHVGPTLVDVTQQPSGVRAYASRNQAGDTTEVIVVNWNDSSIPLAFEVNGPTTTLAPTTFTLPAMSIAAVEIPDKGMATAWTYGDAQQRANAGPAPLLAGAFAPTDAGPPLLTNSCSADASVICSTIVLPSPAITSASASSGTNLVFGTPPYQWRSYAYGCKGQSAPSATLTPDGNGLAIQGAFVPPVTETWIGVGFYFDSTSCIDAKTYTGVRFDYSGDLGDCSLAFGANYSGNASTIDDPARGACPMSNSVCYPPQATLTLPSGTDGGESGPTTIKVPFTSLVAGSPNATIDPSTLVTVQWQLNARSGGTGCAANFTVQNVAFY